MEKTDGMILEKAKASADKLNYIPKGGDIVIAFPKVDEKTKSGLYKSDEMLESEKKKAQSEEFHVALAVGPENKEVKVGNHVIIRDGGYKITVNGIEYLQVDQYNILGVVCL